MIIRCNMYTRRCEDKTAVMSVHANGLGPGAISIFTIEWPDDGFDMSDNESPSISLPKLFIPAVTVDSEHSTTE